MRLQKYLNEKYIGTATYLRLSSDIFENPTRKEIREISKKGYGVRFIADSKTKKIYMGDGYNAFHNMIWDTVRKTTGDNRNSPYVGTLMSGELYDKEIVLSGVDMANALDREKWSKIDWSWTKKWLPNIDREIEKYKKERGYDLPFHSY
jgi:hypothetical protein